MVKNVTTNPCDNQPRSPYVIHNAILPWAFDKFINCIIAPTCILGGGACPLPSPKINTVRFLKDPFTICPLDKNNMRRSIMHLPYYSFPPNVSSNYLKKKTMEHFRKLKLID